LNSFRHIPLYLLFVDQAGLERLGSDLFSLKSVAAIIILCCRGVAVLNFVAYIAAKSLVEVLLKDRICKLCR